MSQSLLLTDSANLLDPGSISFRLVNQKRSTGLYPANTTLQCVLIKQFILGLLKLKFTGRLPPSNGFIGLLVDLCQAIPRLSLSVSQKSDQFQSVRGLGNLACNAPHPWSVPHSLEPKRASRPVLFSGYDPNTLSHDSLYRKQSRTFGSKLWLHLTTDPNCQ